MSDRTPWGFYLAIVLVGVSLWIGAVSLIPESVAQDAAKGLGYTNIEVRNRFPVLPFSKCGEGDIVQWDVSGTNPSGQRIDFTVCAGLFKGGTPRF